MVARYISSYIYIRAVCASSSFSYVIMPRPAEQHSISLKSDALSYYLCTRDERLTAAQTGTRLCSALSLQSGNKKLMQAKWKLNTARSCGCGSHANWQVAEQADTYLKSIEPKSTFTPTDDLDYT